MIEKIKKMMNYYNLNQKQLAEILKIDNAYMCRLLKGERKITVEVAKKIANYFNVSLDWLLNEKK